MAHGSKSGKRPISRGSTKTGNKPKVQIRAEKLNPTPSSTAGYLGLAVLGETLHAASLLFQPWKAVSELKAEFKRQPNRQAPGAPTDTATSA